MGDLGEVDESLDVFSEQEREKGILKGRNVCFRPFSDNVEGPHIFNLEPQGEDHYLKLNSVRLAGRVRIYYDDRKTPLEPDADVSIVNMFPHSLFRAGEVEMNNTLVSELSTSMAHYQAYMGTTLSYNKNAQTTHLASQLYIPDEAAKFDLVTYNSSKIQGLQVLDSSRWQQDDVLMEVFKNSRDSIVASANATSSADAKADNYMVPDNIDSIDGVTFKQEFKKMAEQNVTVIKAAKKYAEEEAKKQAAALMKDYVATMYNKAAVNSGYVERRKIIQQSKEFDFYIPLAADIFQSNRVLHPSVSLRIKLSRAPDEFSILSSSGHKYFIELSQVKLFARYMQLSPEVVAKHALKLAKKEALIYPIQRTIMRSHNIPQGERSVYVSNLFYGKALPKTIIIGFVETDAYHGSLQKNPWNFKHFNLESAIIRVNGENCPADPIRPDFENDLFMREYIEFYRNIGIDISEDGGNLITPNLYRGGSFFLSFDLTGDQCNMLHHHKTQSGAIDFNAVFKNVLDVSVTMVVYAMSEAQIEIGENGPIVKYI